MTKYLCGTRNRSFRFITNAGAGLLPYEGNARPGDIIATWGTDGPSVPAGVRVLNPHLVINKNVQVHMLREAGVPAPKSWDSTREWRELGEPQPILRKKIYSASGWGIELLQRPEEMWVDGDPERMIHQFDIGGGRIRECYFQEYIDKDVEYRLTQVGPHIAYLMIKHRVPGQVVWNIRAGSTWEYAEEISSTLRERLRLLGEASLKAIGYHIGAIDVVAKGRSLYVLEVNSRPQLSEANANKVAKTISDYMDEIRGRNESIRVDCPTD